MNIIKKYLYQGFGFFCVGMAYIGFVTPGIPFSIFLVMAAWAFAKSSPRMHKWLYNHKHFGPFLTNWNTKKSVSYKRKIRNDNSNVKHIGIYLVHYLQS